MNKLIKMLGISSVILTGGGVLAEEGVRPVYTLTVTEAGGNQNAWTTPSLWSNEVDKVVETAFSSEHDYFVKNYSKAKTAFVLRTPAGSSDHFEFVSHSVILGSLTEGKGHAQLRIQCRGDGTGVMFPNDGLILPRGYVQAYYGQGSVSHLYGKVTVTSPEGYPSRFTSGAYNVNTILHVHGALAGGPDAYLEVIPVGAVNKTNFTCRISNATQFLGTMDVQNVYESDGVPWGKMWLELGNTTVGGSLIMGADTQLSGIADETTTGFTVASLTLKTGSVLDLTRGGLTVTQSLTVESTPFTVKVAGLAQEDVTAAQLQNLLTFPASSGYTAKDFVLDGDLGGGELVVREEDGAIKIGLQYYPEAKLLTTDSSRRTEDGTSAMTNSVQWSNEAAWPDAVTMPGDWRFTVGAGLTLRTLYEGNNTSSGEDPYGDQVFAGHILTLNGGSLMVLGDSFTCGDLRLANGGTVMSSLYIPNRIAGKLTVGAGAQTVSSYCGNIFRIESELAGEGELVVSGVKGSSSSTPYGRVWIAGTNTAFRGTIKATIAENMPADPVKDINKITPRFDRNYTHLLLSCGGSLGGPLAAPNPKALTLENMSRLEIGAGCSPLTLDEPTRGIFISWVGRFLAEEGETMTIASPLAVDGTLWKEGDGLLVLRNPAPTFGADATATEPVGNPASHMFRIAGGDVKIASVDAVNGLDVVFTNGAGRLVLDLDGTDADLKAYGIRNVKTDDPFAVEGDLTGVKLELSAATVPTEEFSVAVLTVRTSAYEKTAALFGRLAKSATLKGWRISCAPRDNGDDTTTMVATAQRTGFTVLIK